MIGAILRAQWQSLRNLRAGKGGAIFSFVMSLAWYGFWTALAFGAYAFTANPESRLLAQMVLPRGLMFIMLYWQFTPLLVASLGASLDLKKLLVYPVPAEKLFWVETLLRLTTGVEMMLVLSGTAMGLICNPLGGGWARAFPVLSALFVFTACNLLCAAGLRNLLERLLSRKRLREFLVVLFVLGLAAPQMLIATRVSDDAVRQMLTGDSSLWLPWSAAARLFLYAPQPAPWLVLSAWTVAAYFFGRWQFARSLRFDSQAEQATDTTPQPRGSRIELFYRLPGWFLPDPVGVMVEKEIRTLARSPRFRLVFIMGFTFGLLLWLPMMLRGRSSSVQPLERHFLALVCGYALILLGQVSYWNAFGFDRSAVQVYFSLPVSLSRTLLAKNIAALLFVVLEMAAVTAAFSLSGMPLGLGNIVEAYAVTLVVGIYLIAAGNISSVRMPKAMNPERSVQGGSGNRAQALILLVYPVALMPVLLAYGGRYAFRSDAVFWLLLAFAAMLGAVVYWIAMDSSVRAAGRRREQIVTELARADGPVASA